MKRYLMTVAVGLGAAALAGPAWAQELTPQEELGEGKAVVRLNAAELIETKNTMEILTQADMERKTATNLFDALRGEPGITFQEAGMGRNNTRMIRIRGFNQSQIKIVLDDIPVSTNWRREYDLGRFSVWDLESVEISKGYSSTLLGGVSGMGGVVNMRSARPQKELEFKALYRNYFDREFGDEGREMGASVGTKQDQFFLKASAYKIKKDYLMLPDGVKDYSADKDGKQKDYHNDDTQINLMAGWTPTEDTELMVGYFKHDGEKGGFWGPTGTSKTYTIEWPDWNTERTYMTFSAKPTDKSYLKANAYYEEHQDTVKRYVNGAPPPPPPGNRSDYTWSKKFDDKTYGGRLEYGYAFNERHKLAVSATYRNEKHKENLSFSGDPYYDADVSTYDLGAEYTYKPIEPLSLVLGAAYREQKTDKVDYYDAGGTNRWYKINKKPTYDALDYQFGAFYDLTDQHEIHFTYARKTNIPPQRDLFSWNSSRWNNYGIWAADWLKPEKADHFELGYKGDINDWLELTGAFFYSRVHDLIGNRTLASGATVSANVGKVDYSGFEAGFKAISTDWLTLGGNVSHLITKPRSAISDKELIDMRPEWTAQLYAVITPVESLSIIPTLYASGSGSYYDDNFDETIIYSGYATMDLKALYDVTEWCALEVGVQNLFDANYRAGAPGQHQNSTSKYYQPGRTFFLGAQFNY